MREPLEINTRTHIYCACAIKPHRTESFNTRTKRKRMSFNSAIENEVLFFVVVMIHGGEAHPNIHRTCLMNFNFCKHEFCCIGGNRHLRKYTQLINPLT